jgi:hypothetical protein
VKEADRKRAEAQRAQMEERIRQAEARLERERDRLQREQKRAADVARAKAEREVRAEGRRQLRESEAAMREKYEDRVRQRDANALRENRQLKTKLADLQRRLESAERVHLGPQGEQELVASLRAAFPGDVIDLRGKGGDVLHTVMEAGKACGTILYEVKNTQQFQTAFTRQLKNDLERHDTPYGLLVTRAMPGGRSGVCEYNGVWVVTPALASVLASVFREFIVALAKSKLSTSDVPTKMVKLYEYLRSEDFRTGVERIEDRVREMRDALKKEESSHRSAWQLREQQMNTIARDALTIKNRVSEVITEEHGGRVRAVH